MRRISILSAVLALSTAAVRAEEIHPGYAWQDLGNGLYVHTRVDPLAGPVDGNSTVIVNDQDVIVVDTHIDPAAARAVIGKIRQITDKPVTHVVNTHWHDDHTNGNHAYRQAFPDAKIIAHRATLAALREEWQAMEDERRATYERLADRDLLAAADAIQVEDPQRAIGVRVFAGYRAALEPELPTMELVYPDLLLEDRMVFQRGPRTIEVSWLGRGNTEGDVVVWLPEERVLVTGDMLVAPIPFAFDSPMRDWIETLGKLAEFGAETLVPGHGPVQTDSRHLERVARLLEATVATVEKARAAGVAYGDLEAAVDLSEQEALFTRGEPMHVYAWRSYYLSPGLKSAWAALGYPVPEADSAGD